jgi:hypothetical protein
MYRRGNLPVYICVIFYLVMSLSRKGTSMLLFVTTAPLLTELAWFLPTQYFVDLRYTEAALKLGTQSKNGEPPKSVLWYDPFSRHGTGRDSLDGTAKVFLGIIRAYSL